MLTAPPVITFMLFLFARHGSRAPAEGTVYDGFWTIVYDLRSPPQDIQRFKGSKNVSGSAGPYQFENLKGFRATIVNLKIFKFSNLP